MRLPAIVIVLGYAGLVPFLLGPAWLAFAPGSAPAWLDRAWTGYVTLLAAFLAGTFWGFALPAAQGPNGILGMLIASGLMLLTWLAMLLAPAAQLHMLVAVFVLQLVADYWRERTLDTLPGYLRLRLTLTIGAIAALLWRMALA